MNKVIHQGLKLNKCDVNRVGPFTVAHCINEEGIESFGIAKLSPRDEDIPEKGKDIAVGRARRAMILKQRNEEKILTMHWDQRQKQSLNYMG